MAESLVPGAPHKRGVIGRMYHGETSIDFVGRTKLWFTISVVAIAIGVLSLVTRGLNFGIDFEGGVVWEVPANGVTVAEARDALAPLGLADAQIQTVSSETGERLRVSAERVGEGEAATTTSSSSSSTTTESTTTSTAPTTASTTPVTDASGSTVTTVTTAPTSTATTAPASTTTTLPSATAQQTAQERRVSEALAELTGTDVDEVSFNFVGSTWGSEISQKAAKALIVFLVAITLYISFRFEFKMAMPTLAALIHDILITVGVYSIFGFVVTPATVIAVLTILGFSIYDGIVVFDKVDENTRLVSVQGKMAYGDMVNLSLNQTLMRSLNTSLTALLPIASLLIVGSVLLGAQTLEDFALALLIGLASGAYSSIFIASPLLAVLKEREPRYRDLRRRLESRGERRNALTPHDAAAEGMTGEDGEEKVAVGAGAPVAAGSGPATRERARPSGAIPPRPRKKGKRR